MGGTYFKSSCSIFYFSPFCSRVVITLFKPCSENRISAFPLGSFRAISTKYPNFWVSAFIYFHETLVRWEPGLADKPTSQLHRCLTGPAWCCHSTLPIQPMATRSCLLATLSFWFKCPCRGHPWWHTAGCEESECSRSTGFPSKEQKTNYLNLLKISFLLAENLHF